MYWFIGAGRGWLQHECSGQKGFEEHLVTQTDRPLREVGIGADDVMLAGEAVCVQTA